MKIYPFNRSSIIGLDIQPDAARLIQLTKARRSSQIERIAMRPMPTNLFTAGKIQRWEVLSSVLGEWFEELGILHQSAAISLPMSVVRVQQISLPASLQDVEIEAAIFSHLQRDMPGLNDPLTIDFSVLGKSHKQITVLFMAVREAYLANHVECVRMAGLKVKIVDVDIYALMRMVDVKHATYAILHVKNKVTEWVVFSQKEVIFHQQWEADALNEWIEKLNDNIQLYFSMPEKKELQRVVVCGSEEYVSAASEVFRDQGVVVPRLVRGIQRGNQTSQKQPRWIPRIKRGTTAFTDEPISSDFLVAYSLAMRETPPW